MAGNATLRQLTGLPDSPAPLAESTLIMIDLQNTYTRGVMELEHVQPAIDQAEELLSAASAKNLIFAGFMTHMCVNSSTRGAFNLGYAPTVVSGATATRALPGADGAEVSASALQAASLAALADMFSVVVANPSDIPH